MKNNKTKYILYILVLVLFVSTISAVQYELTPPKGGHLTGSCEDCQIQQKQTTPTIQKDHNSKQGVSTKKTWIWAGYTGLNDFEQGTYIYYTYQVGRSICSTKPRCNEKYHYNKTKIDKYTKIERFKY